MRTSFIIDSKTKDHGNDGKGEEIHHIGNTIKLKQLNWTHYKPQSNKQSQHSSPRSCGCKNIFSFIWKKQITARVKVRTSLPRTPLPLDSNINSHHVNSSIKTLRIINDQIMVKPCRYNNLQGKQDMQAVEKGQ